MNSSHFTAFALFNPSLISFRGRKFSDRVSDLSLKEIFQEETEKSKEWPSRSSGYWPWVVRLLENVCRDGCLCHLVLGTFCVICYLGSKGWVLWLFKNCTGSRESKVSGCDFPQDSSFPPEPQVNLPLSNLLMRFHQQKESVFSMILKSHSHKHWLNASSVFKGAEKTNPTTKIIWSLSSANLLCCQGLKSFREQRFFLSCGVFSVVTTVFSIYENTSNS